MTVPLRLARGDTLLIFGTGPNSDPGRGHLHIVLTEISVEGSQLIVPVCSRRERSDATCLLGLGDHKFITKASYVDYHKMSLILTANANEMLGRGMAKLMGPIDEKIFCRVCLGVTESRLSAPKYKALFENQKSQVTYGSEC